MNKYRPHLLVLPEDDANQDIANGFLLHPSVAARTIQVLPTAGGWTRARDAFLEMYAAQMNNNPYTHVVLLVDFDDRDNRLDQVTDKIPAGLRDRVFVIGARSEPEELRRAGLGTFEEIGFKLAEDCRSGASSAWDHDLLKHNHAELNRMLPILRPILFRG